MVAGRNQYTEDTLAQVYVCLRANGGNVKRTARDTGIPVSTIRRWRDQWESGESPPDVSLVAIEANDFISDAERVRNKALRELERKIPSATASALVSTVGMLSDKIALVRGLATTRVEHKHTLPAVDELRELMQDFVRGAVTQATIRSGEIIDADVLAEEDTTYPRIESPDKS